MYDLYVEKCQSEGKQILKEKFYYYIFSTKFNLHFKVPAKDTCSRLKIIAETKMTLKGEVNLNWKRNCTWPKFCNLDSLLKIKIMTNLSLMILFKLNFKVFKLSYDTGVKK